MEEKTKGTWGGARPGSGRPKGTTNKELGREGAQRTQHQVRAFPDEWELIRLFTKITRTHPAECKAFIEKYKQG